jgi:hypothetical protein
LRLGAKGKVVTDAEHAVSFADLLAAVAGQEKGAPWSAFPTRVGRYWMADSKHRIVPAIACPLDRKMSDLEPARLEA